MTDAEWQELGPEADAHFAHHLEGAAWSAFSSVEKRAAVVTAALDIAALLHRRTVDWTCPAQQAAVFEQALFLRRKATASPALVAEAVEGVGSRSYQPPSAVPGEYAERALRLLADYLHPRSLSLNRG